MAKFEQYKDKNNKRKWLFSGYIATDPLTDKKIVTSRRGFDTKAEASIELDRMKAKILKGSRKKRSITFEELYDDWLLQYRKSVKESKKYQNLQVSAFARFTITMKSGF